MFRIIERAAVLVLVILVSISEAYASDKPSAGAEGMAGAEGTFAFKPDDWMEGTTSWWKDSDGADGTPNGRMFGEACLPNGLLVESNPTAGELHSHANDVGHPDMFDCKAWCVGEGASGGACAAAPAPPCAESAYCACN